jgi:acetyl esterase/lipase
MNFAAITVLIGLFFSSAVTSCNKGNKTGETKDTAVMELDMKNVSYGRDTAQKLDVYLPANRDTSNTKVLLFIHGGSWIGGDKSEFNEAIAAIHPKLQGYAIFNTNYRLVNNSADGLSDQITDIKSVLNFIESKAEEYKINANKICLVGASAGAHLALLHAYKNNSEGKIKAVVDLFGPTDLKDLYNNHPVPQQVRYILTSLLGKSAASDASLYQQASPVNFVNAQTVPTCIFHGTNDMIVPISQSNALKAKLLANNVKVEMTAYAAEGHGWYGKNLLDTYAKTIQFIKENVN